MTGRQGFRLLWAPCFSAGLPFVTAAGPFPSEPDCMPDWPLATSVGLFLFTRILIPDVLLTLVHYALFLVISARDGL